MNYWGYCCLLSFEVANGRKLECDGIVMMYIAFISCHCGAHRLLCQFLLLSQEQWHPHVQICPWVTYLSKFLARFLPGMFNYHFVDCLAFGSCVNFPHANSLALLKICMLH